MSYTPPAADAIGFSFAGADAYTPPAFDAISFSFGAPLPGVESIVTGLPGAGLPMAYGEQGAAILITGDAALGSPSILAASTNVALVRGHGGLGDPYALALGVPQAARVIGEGSLGQPEVTSFHGYKAIVQGLPLSSLPLAVAWYDGRFIRAQVRSILGIPQARAWAFPAAAATITPGIVRYYCKLTGADDGLEDAVLPISNFTVRHRNEAPSYYAVTIPSYAYVGDLTARPHGEIVIWSEQSGISEELMRGALGQVAVYRGANSQSITIQGNSERATTPPLTYRLDAVTYLSTTFGGESRLRIDPRAAIRPGDYVRYQDIGFTVGDIAWSVSVSAGGLAATMELASLPLEA